MGVVEHKTPDRASKKLLQFGRQNPGQHWHGGRPLRRLATPTATARPPCPQGPGRLCGCPSSAVRPSSAPCAVRFPQSHPRRMARRGPAMGRRPRALTRTHARRTAGPPKIAGPPKMVLMAPAQIMAPGRLRRSCQRRGRPPIRPRGRSWTGGDASLCTRYRGWISCGRDRLLGSLNPPARPAGGRSSATDARGPRQLPAAG